MKKFAENFFFRKISPEEIFCPISLISIPGKKTSFFLVLFLNQFQINFSLAVSMICVPKPKKKLIRNFSQFSFHFAENIFLLFVDHICCCWFFIFVFWINEKSKLGLMFASDWTTTWLFSFVIIHFFLSYILGYSVTHTQCLLTKNNVRIELN